MNSAASLENLLPKKELNPKFWNQEKQLNQEVREHLLRIALEFKKYLKLEDVQLNGKVEVVDVLFTGSLANYNWSEYSDIDLHLLLSFDNVPNEEVALAMEYLQARKALWMSEHDIQIFDFDVELYPQEKDQPHFATGVYSIAFDKWTIEPEPTTVNPDRPAIKLKVAGFLNIIRLLGTSEMSPTDMVKSIEILQKKIKKMRQAGLEADGEFSTENLVFKILRRLGVLDTIDKLKSTILDKSISLENQTA